MHAIQGRTSGKHFFREEAGSHKSSGRQRNGWIEQGVRTWGGDRVQEGVEIIGKCFFWSQQEDAHTDLALKPVYRLDNLKPHPSFCLFIFNSEIL